MGSYLFLVFFLIAILSTWWGWSRVIAPIGVPVVWTVWRLLHATMITMILLAPIQSGWWFRTYGYDFSDIAIYPILSDGQRQRMHWTRENNTELNGDYNQDWRKKRGLKQLPPDWNGHSEHSTNPLWSLLIPIGAIGGYLLLEKRYQSIHNPKPRERRHKLRNLPSAEDQSAQLNRILERSAARQGKPFAASVAGPVKQPTQPTVGNDKEFTAALRGLGYTITDIRDVALRCTEQDLEARVRHALQILARK